MGDENDILEFATEWAPYGGNDDEAFVRFGLSSKEFHTRLMRLLGSPAARALSKSTLVELRHQCIDRLNRAGAWDARSLASEGTRRLGAT
ncbi:DUF3263 domain-containing protein [Nocardia lijiangensis]|uniref:DUF3263 domain-containing protein n=1 Tax=Nocardia lijiangensis TaxID=299618 RepID=UPI003D7526DE